MASTTEAARLTEAHRLAQVRIGVQTVRRMLTIWPLLDLNNLDASTVLWLRVAIPVIQAQRQASATLATDYLAAFRDLEIGAADFAPVIDNAADIAALTTSLTVTGPAELRAALGRGATLTQATESAQTASARAAMRHALAGGRNTIVDSVDADQRALGWARATSGKCCAFCAMLASRGPVYKSRATVQFRAHDGCACTAEPVYRRGSEWPPGAREFRETWDDTTSGLSGNDALNAFRRDFSPA